MTDNVSKFNTASSTLANENAAGAGYKKGIAAVNLAAEFMARGVNLHGGNQSEK